MKVSRKDTYGARFMGIGNSRAHKAGKLRATFGVTISAFLAMLFLVTTIAASLTPISTGALAKDEDDAKDTIQKAAKDYVVQSDNPEDSFYKTMDKFDKEGKPNRENNTFAAVIGRMLTTSYLNETSTGSAAGGQQNGIGGSGFNCDPNVSEKNTPLYHNCDVPNIATELFQDLLGFVAQQGPQFAEIDKTTLDSKWFGLPSEIPGDGAPVDPNARSVKYTGLEIFGYNMRFTSYLGEYDHIKVMTSARALSNFGFMDSMKMSITAIAQGVAGGINKAATNFASNISQGDVFGAIGGLFSGFFEGFSSATINSIIDTSDLNVFNTQAWYRVGYGGTLYNGRELTGEEISANAKSQLVNMLSSNQPDKANIPKDLQEIQNGPPAPKEAISKCTFNNADNKSADWGDVTLAPGPTNDACKNAAKAAFDTRQSKPSPPANDNANFTWSADGTQKSETLAQWKDNNKSVFDTAKKYEIACELDTNEANRANNLAAFNSCWPGAWDTAAEKAQTGKQEEANTDWINQMLSGDMFRKWVQAEASRNFNAPWNRFVCTDANGKDMKDGTALVMMYDFEGKLNPKCSQARPPIQNGFFGNGYVQGRAMPANDTRYDALDKSVFSALVPLNSIVTVSSNAGLQVSVFMTRLSNTIINLSFSPVFETLGLNTLVVKVIETIRDSVFFPLISFMVAIMGIMALISAGKNRDYGRQAVSILLMVGTIMVGVFLMYKPAEMLKVADNVPAQVEAAVIGSIFSVGNSNADEVCTATGTVSQGAGVGLDGKPLSYNPNDGTRALMCENWRVFAFNPWVQGQWGTSFDKLYANSTQYADKMKNTNASLVGNADVKMGGDVTVNNWALYQLQTMGSGTASMPDAGRPSGSVDRNFYRLVDMQAGPDNGAGTDSTYFKAWNGSNFMPRLQVGFTAPIVGTVGAIVVMSYAIAKIQISFVIVVMLLILPIMFLLGVHPTQGRMKLKGYFGTLIGLAIQRVVLVVIMAVMFKVLVGFGNASTNYLLNAMMALITAIVFLKLKKPVLAMIFNSISASVGSPIGGQFVSDPDAWRKEKLAGGGLIGNTVERFGTATASMATGAIGGYLAGGASGAGKGIKQSMSFEMQNLRNRQRRRGFKLPETILKGGAAGKEYAEREMEKDVHFKETRNEVLKNTASYKKYQSELAAWNKLPTQKTSTGEVVRLDSQGNVVDKPKSPQMKSAKNARMNRNIAQMNDLQKKINKKKAKLEKETFQSEASDKVAEQKIQDYFNNKDTLFQDVRDTKDNGGQQDVYSEKQQKDIAKIQKQEARVNKAKSRMAKLEEHYQQRDIMAQQLQDMFDKARGKK